METKDIVKGLLVHINQEIECEICPYQNVINCNETLIKDAVKLIESQFRPQGEWISTKAKRIFSCSRCGNYLDFDHVNYGRGSANFCPNCGAKMQKGGKE